MKRPIPASMMPPHRMDNHEYVEWVLLRCTEFYCLRMGAGMRLRERHNFTTPAEAVRFAQENRGLLVYGAWSQDLRSELLPKRLYPAVLSGEFVPYYFRTKHPKGIWKTKDVEVPPEFPSSDVHMDQYYPEAEDV